MSYHVEVSPEITQSTHHVSLTDGEKTLGLIICDSKGAADPYNISMSPNARSSLRTKTGTTKYEDLDEPWSATAQDDWSGGRALEDYENDTTRFFDSKRCQTAFSQVYNAPLDYYAVGLHDAVTNYPGSVTWKTITAGTIIAHRFVLSAATNAGQIYVLLRRRGEPESGLTVRLCSTGTNGLPGTVLASYSHTVDEVTDVISEWRKFVFPSQTLAAGVYWILVTSDAGDSSDYWQVGMKPVDLTDTLIKKAGSDWRKYEKFDLYFRMAAADDGRRARFFTYKELTFALTQTDTGSPKLFMNGDIGMADANTGQLNKVIDATKSWTTDQWKGCRVGIIAGQGIQETVSIWRTIVSNDATSLTLDEPWINTQDTTTTYVIVDTDLFIEIPAATHKLTGYVTDIMVANGIIFFAQGDSIPIQKMKWDNGTWYSMADQYVHLERPAPEPEEEETEGSGTSGSSGSSGSASSSLDERKKKVKKWLKAALKMGSISQYVYEELVNKYHLDEEDERTPQEITVKNCATFLQTVRDSTGLVLWRAQNDDAYHQISVSRSAVTDWLPESVVLCDLSGEDPDLDERTTATEAAKNWLSKALEDGVITAYQYYQYMAFITGSTPEIIETIGTTQGTSSTSSESSGTSSSTSWIDDALANLDITEEQYYRILALLTGGSGSGSGEDEPVETDDKDPIIDSENDELYTEGVAFAKPDDCSVMYKVTVGKISGDDHPMFSVILQGSEDNIIYQDLNTITIDSSHAIYYFACRTKAKWRRIYVKIAGGDSPQLFSLKVETVNYSRFIDPYAFNDSYGKITGLAEYPMMLQTTMRTLWINREGMIHSISSEGAVDTINLEELSAAMDEKNGITSMEHSNYYYVKWMKAGIQRYYNLTLDSVGPDRDTGLPAERQGNVVDMLAYPGRYFAAIDAGKDGYSSVLMNNNSGWHEIYRAPNIGERITALGFQSISGDRPDKLWIAVGNDIVRLVMPSNTLKAYYDPASEYTHESVLVSSWFSIGMVDVVKQWGSMNVMAENLTDRGVYIEADYQIDQDPVWHPMSAHYTESPTQAIKFESAFGISAKRLRYRLRLQTNDKSKTPFVKAVVLKTVIRIDTKYCYSLSCRNVANDKNLCGEVEDMLPWQRLDTLIGWANNATALRMRAFTYPFDDKIVFVDPPNVSNLREKDQPGMLIQLTMNEI